jgi:hypothetical protein
MRAKSSRHIVLAFVLLATRLSFAQAPPPPKTVLSVDGYAGEAPVVRINGKSYVEIDALARATNGTVSFQTNRITLSLPAPGAVAAPGQEAAAPKLSKPFLRTVIDEMSVLAEWRAGLANAIQSNGTITEQWADGYKRNADSRLELASTAASTEQDRSLLAMLRTESNNIHALSDKYVGLRKSQSFVDQDALKDDALDQQVESCASGLTAVATSGQFVDVGSCH